MNLVNIITHPTVEYKLTQMRHKSTCAAKFRTLMHEISLLLAYEASKVDIINEDGIDAEKNIKLMVNGRKVEKEKKNYIIPVLRSGLGMVNAFQDIFPDASVYHIGMYHPPHSELPIQYYNKLPKYYPSPLSTCFLLEPSISSGSKILAILRMLSRWGAKIIKIISLIGSEEIIKELEIESENLYKMYSVRVKIYLVSNKEIYNKIENRLEPGLGDISNRLFNCTEEDIEISGLNIENNQEINENTIYGYNKEEDLELLNEEFYQDIETNFSVEGIKKANFENEFFSGLIQETKTSDCPLSSFREIQDLDYNQNYI